ncbi:CFI-box-CTERM domain-containing protein [Longimicrobium sp.]|uniref:CFI-box-CTERM domain-containing protein n=1 Tax=Longimicrobium sp. TaxID=2029185 RepID=UPI0039C96152
MHLCKDTIEGVAFRDPFDNNTPKTWHLSPQYEAQIKAKLDLASTKLRALDSTYSPPVLDKQKADACFVVTATMGSPDHPYVSTLRLFRDQELATRPIGRSFIEWYRKNGPKLAALIADRPILRRAALHLLVRPAAALATMVQREREGGDS